MVNEEALKKVAKEQQYADANTIGGAQTPYRPPTITERLQKKLEYSRQEAQNSAKLEELCNLLAKNPDVARILDLIQEVGY